MRKLLCCALLGGTFAAAVSAQEPADVVFHNGVVFTADEAGTLHRAAAVRDGKIVAVGGDDLTARYSAPQLVDLRGRMLIPGFNDTHTHIRGRPRRYVEMTGVRSLGEFKERLRSKAAELGPGEWVIGYGWSEDELAEGRRPLRGDLDDALPKNPAVITRAGGHSAVANSLALQLAEVTRDTPDPEGGLIERGPDGEPNGIFRENWRMIARLIPPPTREEIRASLVENLRAQFAFGITSFTEAMTGLEAFALWEDVYAEHRGELPRATVQIHLPVGRGEGWQAADRLASMALVPRLGDEFLRVGALKLFVDGGYTGPAAWTLEGYHDQPEYFGHPRLGEEDLAVVLARAHELGWQLGIHAIGDAAIKMAVDRLAAVLEATPRPDHRHYLNHFTVLPPEETLRKMARHGIHIAQQPNFTYTLEGRYATHLSDRRLQTNNALRTPMNHGILVALGADILPTDPLLGIYAAVTRRGMSGRVYGAGERITVSEALVGYTRLGAFLTFDEHFKGTIAVGKAADLVVLSDNLLQIDPDRIREVEVDMTFLGGRLVYQRDPASTSSLWKKRFPTGPGLAGARHPLARLHLATAAGFYEKGSKPWPRREVRIASSQDWQSGRSCSRCRRLPHRSNSWHCSSRVPSPAE